MLSRMLTYRQNALKRFINDNTKSTAIKEALARAELNASSAIKTANKNLAKSTAKRVNDAFKKNPGGHAAFQALKQLQTHTTAPIDALRDASGTLHTKTEDKLAAQREHYKNMATPAPDNPSLPEEIKAHHTSVQNAVAFLETHPGPDHPILDREITRDEIETAINKLKFYKSSGIDNIPAEFLKHGGNAAIHMTLTLFSLLWQTELTPSTWRKGIIVSLFKAGDRTDCSNYRPITLLTIPDKLYTSIIAKRLELFVPLHEHQSAFRRLRGTHDELFTVAAMLQAREKLDLITYAFFLDLKKAYDTVWLIGLMYKLHLKGVTGKTWRIIKELYSKGQSAPRLDGLISDFFDVRQGVAQGCPLSTILFDIDIDDLLEAVQTLCQDDGILLTELYTKIVGLGFADDIAVFSGTREGLQRIINVLKHHLDLWKKISNIIKSNTATFQRKKKNRNNQNNSPTQESRTEPETFKWGPSADAAIIPHKTKTKLLGVIFTEDCTWSSHIKYACSKGHGQVYRLKKLLKNRHLDRDIKLTMIRIYVDTAMTYGAEIWCPSTNTELNKLEVPRRTALRMALGLPTGPSKRMFPSCIIHTDTNTRPFRSELCAGHLRLYAKYRAMPSTRFPRQALAMLENLPRHPRKDSPNNSQPPHKDWLHRTLHWQNTVLEPSHPSPVGPQNNIAQDPLQSPSTETPRAAAPISNQAINKAVAIYDKAEYIRQAKLDQRPQSTIIALTQSIPRQKQPYITHTETKAKPILSFRSGIFPGDGPPQIFRPHEPLYTRCPDCNKIINGMVTGQDHLDNTKQDNIMLHRLINCEKTLTASDWYHDAAVRIVPTLQMAQTIWATRHARTLSEAGNEDEARRYCTPLMRHLLSPTRICSKTDPNQQYLMIEATNLFLNRPRAFPNAQIFGFAPSITFEDGSNFTPTNDNVTHTFWAAIAQTNFVPSSCEEAEAEAPRVSSQRRSPRLLARASKRAG